MVKKLIEKLKKHDLDSFETCWIAVAGLAFLISMAHYYIGLIF